MSDLPQSNRRQQCHLTAGAVAEPVVSPADAKDALTILDPVEGLGQQLPEETGSHVEWPHSYQFWKAAIAKIDAAKANRGK